MIAKQIWKPGNMVYPVPAVLVTATDKMGNDNIITIAWTGTVCTNPPMVYISVKPERYSYAMLEKTKEFVINLTTKDLVFATDFCGVKSGREINKFQKLGLTKEEAVKVNVPVIKESPVNIECSIIKKQELGSHTMFLAEVVAVQADEKYLDQKGRFDLSLAKPIVYSHGEYFCLGEKLGKFGYSIRKSDISFRKRMGEEMKMEKEMPTEKQVAKSLRKGKKKKLQEREQALKMQLFPEEKHAYKKYSIDTARNSIKKV